MSGGIAYVWDPDGRLGANLNVELVDLEELDAEDVDFVRDLVASHVELTGSELGSRLLDDWDRSADQFVKVMPRDYRRVLEATKRAIEEGTSVEDAVMAASHG